MEFPCRASERREGTSALHSQICKSFPRPNNSRKPVGGGDRWHCCSQLLCLQSPQVPGTPIELEGQCIIQEEESCKSCGIRVDCSLPTELCTITGHFKAYSLPAIQFMGAAAQKIDEAMVNVSILPLRLIRATYKKLEPKEEKTFCGKTPINTICINILQANFVNGGMGFLFLM